MKKQKTWLMTAALGLASTVAAFAQGFQSGSDGSYGALNVTSNTVLDLPPDGIFHCTTINIEAGRTLTFSRNPLNTPVYLLATSNVVIAGIIQVFGQNAVGQNGGRGGPGGFDGGNGGFDTIPPGAGQGPGAGRAASNPAAITLEASGGPGPGSYGTLAGGATTNKGQIYGSKILIPLVGGSGGGGVYGNPGTGGGGGGGAILIASNTKIIFNGNNEIWAYGGSGAGGGSGGAIRLVSPRIEGSPRLNVNGGSPGGGTGRVRVDVIERDALNLSFDSSSMSLGSFLKVFPTPNTRLDITQAAGTSVPEGTQGPVIVELPFGSTTDRTVTVQARDFAAVVPIRLVLTPEAGDPLTYDTTIDNSAGNPATATVNVTVPVNTRVAVQAWTR